MCLFTYFWSCFQPFSLYFCIKTAKGVINYSWDRSQQLGVRLLEILVVDFATKDVLSKYTAASFKLTGKDFTIFHSFRWQAENCNVKFCVLSPKIISCFLKSYLKLSTCSAICALRHDSVVLPLSMPNTSKRKKQTKMIFHFTLYFELICVVKKKKKQEKKSMTLFD